jgi:hypothetical protein
MALCTTPTCPQAPYRADMAQLGSTMRVDAVFPVIHTPYYLYKELFK